MSRAFLKIGDPELLFFLGFSLLFPWCYLSFFSVFSVTHNYTRSSISFTLSFRAYSVCTREKEQFNPIEIIHQALIML